MNYIKSTQELVLHTKHYIFGDTLDYGAGTAKYRNIIKPNTSTYTTFDMIVGEYIDVVGDVLDAPFNDASFDSVVSTQVLEHVEKPWVMVAEIHRILRHGGVCIVTAPFMFPYHAHPHDFFRFTVDGLESLFKNEDFEIVEIGYYGKMFTVFSEIIHLLFFNPYQPERKSKWHMRIMRHIEHLAGFLDRFSQNRIIYPNVYVVARKKKI